MDKTFLIGGLFVIVCLGLFVLHIRGSKKQAELNRLSELAKIDLKGKPAFLCAGITLLGSDKEKINLYLLGGDFVNVNATAGMVITIEGSNYVITDVSDESGTQVKVIEAQSKTQIGFVGITTNQIDFKSINEKIKSQKLLTFLLNKE